MSKTLQNTVTFDLTAEKGDVTGTTYSGVFAAKTKLSMAERLEKDRIFRNVLGENPQFASVEAESIATAYSYLRIHLIDPIPEFWKGSKFGLDLQDGNILGAVYTGVLSKINDEYKKLEEQAEAARKDLKAAQAKME